MSNKRKLKVYIAGPYTKGDIAVNVATAIRVANEIYNLGMYPYVPHLTHFWHIIHPRHYADWLELDGVFLEVCDAIFKIEGYSFGVDLEIQLAEKLGIPIYYSLHDLNCWKYEMWQGEMGNG